MSQILYMFHAEDHTHSCLAHLWRLPWVWAVHCSPRKAPGQTSSKSELPRAPVPGSPGTGIPQSQIVSAEDLQTNSQASELGKASKVGQIAPLSYPTRPLLLHVHCINCIRYHKIAVSKGSPRPTSCSEGVTFVSFCPDLFCVDSAVLSDIGPPFWVTTTVQHIRRILPFPLQGLHHKRPCASHHIAPLEHLGGLARHFSTHGAERNWSKA